MKLKIEDVSFTYPTGQIGVSDINLEFRGGEVSAILGSNGSGKTTLILISAGLIKPQKGNVTFNGEKLEKLGSKFRSICGFLFQHPEDQLIEPLVWEDIALGPKQNGFSGGELEEKVLMAAERIGIKHLLNRRTHRLSEGEKKKVAIAGLLAIEPRILILDEPIAGLDLKGEEKVIEIIEEFRERGSIVVFTTQSSDLTAALADKVILLSKGKTVAEAETSRIIFRSDLLVSIGVKPLKNIWSYPLKTKIS